VTPHAITCREAFARLDDYLDRELAPDEVEVVKGHLEVCAVCAAEFALEQELLEGIRAKLVHLRMPAGLMAKISAKLAQEGS